VEESDHCRRFDELLRTKGGYLPEDGRRRIMEVFAFAERVHQGQKRRSGEDYIVHPMRVVEILLEWRMDTPLIMAALLHDAIEDSADVSREMLAEEYGPEVAMLVEGVTKITVSMGSPSGKRIADAKSLRKIIAESVQDIRVILLKLADRLDNMRTLEFLDQERQVAISKLTLGIFAPLAARLGMYGVKRELEDLCFRYLDPEQHERNVRRLDLARNFLEAETAEVLGRIEESLAEGGISVRAYVSWRSPYQLARLERPDRTSPLLDIQVITIDWISCYRALGYLHRRLRPVPGAPIRDFIAMPKPNGYQALHTLVLASKNVYPVQIRSEEMERVAQQGILARWTPAGIRAYEQAMQLSNLLRYDLGPQTYVARLQEELSLEKIPVMTPQGEVLEFPHDAIVLDFAYKVHTEVGHHCVGARMNGRTVDVDHHLQPGAVVEIVTDERQQPQAEWLTKVRTARAKSAIKSFLDQQRRAWQREFGRKRIMAEAEMLAIDPEAVFESEEAARGPGRLGLANIEAVLDRAGRGELSPRTALLAMLPPAEARSIARRQKAALWRKMFGKRKRTPKGEPQFRIAEFNPVTMKLSGCCHPAPGTDVVGVPSPKYGIKIHRADCETFRKMKFEEGMVLRIRWEATAGKRMLTRLMVRGAHRRGLYAEVIQAVEEADLPLISSAYRLQGEEVRIELKVESDSAVPVDDLVERLRGREGVVMVGAMAGYRAESAGAAGWSRLRSCGPSRRRWPWLRASCSRSGSSTTSRSSTRAPSIW
jgi:GTP pyrophosphokinase